MVSAWYLLPTLAYESRTRVGSEYHHAQEAVRTSIGLVSAVHLFTFSRGSALSTPSAYPFALSLPVLAIAWVLVGLLLLCRRQHQRSWTRLLLICSGVGVLITVVMTHAGLLLALPRQYTFIQFSYRMETYVLLELCAAILAALVLARGGSRRGRAFTWMALPVCIVSLVGAIQQTRAYPYPGQDRYAALESYGEVETGNNQDYQDASEPVIDARNLATVDFPFSAVHDDRVELTVHLRPGTLVATNIAAGAYMVHVTGAKAVGTDSEDGYMVLAVGAGGAGGGAHSGGVGGSQGSAPTETISVSPADGLPIALGRVLTLAGLAVLVLELLALWARRFRWSSRARRSSSARGGRVPRRRRPQRLGDRAGGRGSRA
jgi:hypothetical protein